MTEVVKAIAKSSAAASIKEKKLAEKYKYVRFVEKKKVLRRMRTIQQSLMKPEEVTEDERKALELQLTELRKDLMYVDKFPGNQKYISLFPSEGALSPECLKKQNEIRSMIVHLTARSEAGDTRKVDVIKVDDFFASADGVAKPHLIEAQIVKPKVPAVTPSTYVKRDKPTNVHPSWDAKKNNEKLTGSIANQKFEGQRLVFGDDDE